MLVRKFNMLQYLLNPGCAKRDTSKTLNWLCKMLFEKCNQKGTLQKSFTYAAFLRQEKWIHHLQVGMSLGNASQIQTLFLFCHAPWTQFSCLGMQNACSLGPYPLVGACFNFRTNLCSCCSLAEPGLYPRPTAVPLADWYALEVFLCRKLLFLWPLRELFWIVSSSSCVVVVLSLLLQLSNVKASSIVPRSSSSKPHPVALKGLLFILFIPLCFDTCLFFGRKQFLPALL